MPHAGARTRLLIVLSAHYFPPCFAGDILCASEACTMPVDCIPLVQFLSRDLLAHQNKGNMGARGSTFVDSGQSERSWKTASFYISPGSWRSEALPRPQRNCVLRNLH